MARTYRKKGKRGKTRSRKSKKIKGVCKAYFPASLIKYQLKIIGLTRKKVSLDKKIQHNTLLMNKQTDKEKKLRKEILILKLNKELEKVNNKLDKTEDKYVSKLMSYADKDKITSKVAGVETLKLTERLNKIK